MLGSALLRLTHNLYGRGRCRLVIGEIAATAMLPEAISLMSAMISTNQRYRDRVVIYGMVNSPAFNQNWSRIHEVLRDIGMRRLITKPTKISCGFLWRRWATGNNFYLTRTDPVSPVGKWARKIGDLLRHLSLIGK